MHLDFIKRTVDGFVSSIAQNMGKREAARQLHLAEVTYNRLCKDMQTNISGLNSERDEFVERNYARWKKGIDALQLLRQTSIEAGMAFQMKFLTIEKYRTDAHLGVLMRLHARANRTAGEIIVLLMNGYADAALARWRTLHEIAVTALLLTKHGPEATQDYIKYGVVQAVDGMEAYQKTAAAMEREPYEQDEMDTALRFQNEIIEWAGTQGKDFKANNGWAHCYIGSGKFEKIQKAVGLEKWWHDYKWASQDVHASYREMRALLAMSEANSEILVCGPSNSGLVEPAHMTAIALSQVTVAFLNAYIETDDTDMDYKLNIMWIELMRKMTDEVGKAFLECAEAKD